MQKIIKNIKQLFNKFKQHAYIDQSLGDNVYENRFRWIII